MKRKMFVLMCCVATLLCICGIAACDLGEDENLSNTHIHTYSTQWSYDEEYHWHKATCEHINEISERAKHSFVNGVCSICKYAQTITTTYTVIFDANDGNFSDTTVKEIEIERGKHLSQIEEPIRDGYIFVGWAKDTAGNQKWNFEVDKVEGEMTLYAVWQKIPPTIVKINYYDGDILLKSEDFATGSIYEASYTPSFVGYLPYASKSKKSCKCSSIW